MNYQEFIHEVFVETQKRILDAFPAESSEEKATREVVTKTDREIETYIRECIQKTYPEHGIVGEEFEDHNSESEYQWVIDPVDGTTNFAHGIPLFCTAIALLHNDTVIAAGVNLPITQTTYTALAGKGAYKNAEQIRALPQELEKGIVGFCHANDQEGIETISRLYEGYKKKTRDFRRLGSANLEICMVASGELAGFLGYRIKPWDFLAGCLIASEAGCSVAGWQDEDWQNLETESVKVSCPNVTL
jgi:myo-inositol-1(or 4)-monophosphatase